MQLDLFVRAVKVRFKTASDSAWFAGAAIISLLLGGTGLAGLLLWGMFNYPLSTLAVTVVTLLVVLVWHLWPRLSDIAEADLPESKPAPKPAVPDSAAAHLPLKVGHSYKPRIPVYRKKITIVLVENDLALGSDGTNYDARTGRFHKGATAPATQWDLVAEVFDDAPSD